MKTKFINEIELKIAFHLNVTEQFSLKTNNMTILHFAKKTFMDFQTNNIVS